MKKMQKGIALLLAILLAMSFTACNTDWVFDYDGEKIPAAVYIGYTLGAYEQLPDQEGYDSTISDPLKQTVNGMSAVDWVKQEARKNCDAYAVITRKFDELGLELEQEKLDEVEEEVDSVWSQTLNTAGLTLGQMYEENGVSRTTYKSMTTCTAKMELVFEAYYGENGLAEVPEEELKAHFKENFTAVNVIALAFKSGDNLSEEDNQSNLAREEKIIQYLRWFNEEGKTFSDCYDDWLHFLMGSEHEDGDNSFGTDDELKNWLSRSSTNYSETFVNAVFNDIEADGRLHIIEDGDSRYLVVRYNDATDENFKEMQQSVLYDVRGELFNKQVLEWAEEMNPKVNSAAVRRYNPKNIH